MRELITTCGITPAFGPEKHEIIPHEIAEFQAVWDTGATNTAVSKAVIDKCKLAPTTVTTVHHAGGVKEKANVYFVNVFLPNRVICSKIHVTEAVLSGNIDVLIGMDIIGLGDFAVTNFENQTKFTFRVPSVAHIDFVKKQNPHSRKKSTKRKKRKR